MSLAEKITPLCAWGTSRAVRIPKDVCESLGIDVGRRLFMKLGHDERGSFIIMRPELEAHRVVANVPYLSMGEIFAGYSDSKQPTECDWGEDVGDEVVE